MESTHNLLVEETSQLNHNISAVISGASMLQKNFSAVVNQMNELLMQNQSLNTQLVEKDKEINDLKHKLEGAETALKSMASESTSVSEGELVE